MPYADREKQLAAQREAQRRFRARMRATSPKWVKAERERRRAYNRTEAGQESNRRCAARWYERHGKGKPAPEENPKPRKRKSTALGNRLVPLTTRRRTKKHLH